MLFKLPNAIIKSVATKLESYNINLLLVLDWLVRVKFWDKWEENLDKFFNILLAIYYQRAKSKIEFIEMPNLSCHDISCYKRFYVREINTA